MTASKFTEVLDSVPPPPDTDQNVRLEDVLAETHNRSRSNSETDNSTSTDGGSPTDKQATLFRKTSSRKRSIGTRGSAESGRNTIKPTESGSDKEGIPKPSPTRRRLRKLTLSGR